MYKYYFNIIDNEYGNQYDYEGYFDDHFEADKFIQENETVGNVVTIIAPYYELVSMDEVLSIYKG
jgi:hypothetical protein